jgi:hypothetical protein
MQLLIRCNLPTSPRTDPMVIVCISLPFLCLAMLAFTFIAVKCQLLFSLPNSDLSPLLDELQKFASPELIEKRTFLAQLAFTPLMTIFLVQILNQCQLDTKLVSKLASQYVPLIFTVTLLYLVFNGEYTKAMLGNYGEASSHTIRWYLLSALFTYIFFLTTSGARYNREKNSRSFGILFIYLSLVLVIVLAWRIISINSVTTDISYSQHLDPIAYVVSQVIQGKKLLVDLPSQYGLYPELISWIFTVVRPSVLGLSVIFGLLQLIAMLAIFYVGCRYIRSRYIQAIFGLVLLIATNATSTYLVNQIDQYFQYWPIRLITPALALFTFNLYLRRPTLLRLFFCSQLSAVSLLWNVDTGVVVTFSTLIYLTVVAIFKCRVEGLFSLRSVVYKLKEAVFFISITLISTCIYFFLLIYQHNAPINTDWLLGYQKLFYGLGYYMLPMPTSRDPWIAVVLVYAIGLLIFFAAKFTNTDSKKADMIFYLSIVGIGLFSYYQGRSHPLNLVNVSWPALLIIAIITDSYLKISLTRPRAWVALIAPSLVMAALNLSALALIVKFPKIIADVSNFVASRNINSDPIIQSELHFINAFSNRDTCAIFSKRQGIYHLELGIQSPIPGPSIVETVLKHDRAMQLNALRNGSVKCLFWGVGESQALEIPVDLMDIFQTVATNQQRTLLYLRRNK